MITKAENWNRVELWTLQYFLTNCCPQKCCPHIETSQLICCANQANQLTGFYMRATLALNGLMRQNECMTTRWYQWQKVKILKCHWTYFLFLQFLYYFYSNDWSIKTFNWFSNIFHLIDKVCPDQLFFVSGRWVLFTKLLAWSSSFNGF